jgi:hypothetical protein
MRNASPHPFQGACPAWAVDMKSLIARSCRWETRAQPQPRGHQPDHPGTGPHLALLDEPKEDLSGLRIPERERPFFPELTMPSASARRTRRPESSPPPSLRHGAQRHGVRHTRVRSGERWFTGPPGSWTASTCRFLSGGRGAGHRGFRDHGDRGHRRIRDGRRAAIVKFVGGTRRTPGGDPACTR